MLESNLNIVLIGILIVIVALFIKLSFKICPEGKVMIIFGKKNNDRPYFLLFKGSVFLIPFFQSAEYLDLSEYSKLLTLNAKGKEGEPLIFDLEIIYSITDDPHVLKNAVNQLIGVPSDRIDLLGANTIELNVKQMVLKEEIVKNDYIALQHKILLYLKPEMEKLGFKIIDVNISFY